MNHRNCHFEHEGTRQPRFFVGALFALLITGRHTCAEVILDGKFGVSGPLGGPNFTIPAEVGATRGNNLFHSFQAFNLSSRESATFTGPPTIQNILARVTGGAPSSIDGMIRSEITGANLFLMNPNGILFGRNAAIDISGSFAATSADYLKLADGARFVATLDADDSVLSSAPIVAFGFLSSKPGEVAVEQTTLEVAEGHGISLVGGNVLLSSANIRAPGGQILLATTHQPGEVPVNGEPPAGLSGMIALHDSSVDASGEGGGRLLIRGGRLTVANSLIESNTQGAGEGKGIDIVMGESIELTKGGQINSLSPDAFGPGGNIEISAPSVRLDGGGVANEFGQPTTQISASSGNFLSEGAAKGGDIRIHAENIEIVNSARISSDSFGAGDAGRIQINAHALLLDSQGSEGLTQISTDSLGFRGGKGGDITIQAESVDVVNGANISSWTLGLAPAGLINIQATSLNILSGAYIGSPTLGKGQAGDIHIAARKLRIDGEETGIVAFTFPDEAAAGGNVQIRSEVVEIVNGGFIITTSFGGGPGGNIDIFTGSLRLDNSATINAAGEGAGRAGNISIHATDSILLANGSSINTSAPDSSGGNINVIAAGDLKLDSSVISALAGLNGGNLSLASGSLLYLLHSVVTGQADATAAGFGNGGNLTLQPFQLVMNDSALISRASFGNGGNISILADYFFASDSLIDASAPFGLPGSVQVTAPELDLSGIYKVLPSNLLDATTLLRPDCGIRLGGHISSFMVLGRGGLPLTPDGFVPSSPLQKDDHSK